MRKYIMLIISGLLLLDAGCGNLNNEAIDEITAKEFLYRWTKTMGGSSGDGGNSITCDPSGNIYVTGFFEGTVDFDPGTGTDNKTSAGSWDIFVTKINSNGTYGWTKTMGGNSVDKVHSIACDPSGNIYITGVFSGTADFDPGAGTDNKTSAGSWDIFVTKINSDGTYGWSKTMGGSMDDHGMSIVCDPYGNIYVTGDFQGTVDFDSGTGTDNKTSAGTSDIFVTKIYSNGAYGWTKTMGGSSIFRVDDGMSIACDPYGNIYVIGTFTGTADFDPGTGTDNKSSAGSDDIFVTKINSDGTYGWTKTMGGSSNDDGISIACDPSGNIYVTGYFYGTVDFDPDAGTDNKTSVGSRDIFVTRINSDGTYGWTKAIGGNNDDLGVSIVCDPFGIIYVTGVFEGTVDFNPGTGTDNKTSVGSRDIFVTKINSDGTYEWTKTMGGSSNDRGGSIVCDPSGNIYVTGFFEGTVDFDPDAGTDNKTSVGSQDIFITKFGY